MHTKWFFISLACIILSVFLLFHLFSSPVSSFPSTTTLHIPAFNSENIPNIVHFVHLVGENASTNPTLEFPFRQFVAIYSAWYYLQPEAIYIHTNIPSHLIKHALSRSTQPYSKLVTSLPGLRFNFQPAPNQTTSGNRINLLPNQSDFVRTAVLKRFGGIYLDDDSYVLRDLKPLRALGFENIVGRQENGQICPAVILSTPGNRLMHAYHSLQDKVFDPNSWARHATDLLTTMVMDFQQPDNQVLIFPQDTFFPYSWWKDGLMDIYRIWDMPGNSPVFNEETKNLTKYINNFKIDGPNTWQKDWRASYVLHGWTFGIESQLNQQDQEEVFGEYKGITLDYVLAKKSNFAQAVYPAVKHALESGIIPNFGEDRPDP